MKRLYKCTPAEIRPMDCVYQIREERPNFFRAYPKQPRSAMALALNVYWWIMTRGKYRVWCAYDEDKVIHTSYVIPKCSKFPFLDETSYEIGPCKTDSAYRGRGIYPAVLSQIVRTGTAYMIVDDENPSSIRGITKAGFQVLPGRIERDRVKRFHYVQES